MYIEEGTLVIDYKSFIVSDGLEYYTALCPQLLFRLLYKKKKRDRVCGKWWIWRGRIIWFVKKKRQKTTLLQKRYTRKDIKNG